MWAAGVRPRAGGGWGREGKESPKQRQMRRNGSLGHDSAAGGEEWTQMYLKSDIRSLDGGEGLRARGGVKAGMVERG